MMRYGPLRMQAHRWPFGAISKLDTIVKPVPHAANTLSARQFFSRRGLLSQWHPAYEFREGQLQMAEAVESALADKRHLIVEAGTGTGKTLAYLLPALLS